MRKATKRVRRPATGKSTKPIYLLTDEDQHEAIRLAALGDRLGMSPWLIDLAMEEVKRRDKSPR